MSASIEFADYGQGLYIQLMIDGQPFSPDMNLEALEKHQKIAALVFAELRDKAERAGAVLEQSHAHRH
jgi:hypothetical protein